MVDFTTEVSLPSYMIALNIQPPSRRQTLVRGSALSVLGNIVRVATGLVSVPLTLTYLGKERYGLWMLTLTSMAFISFLDAGLMPTIKNRMAEAHGKLEIEKFRYYSSGSVSLGLLMMLIGTLVSFSFLAFDWPSIFNVSDPIAKDESLPLVMVVFGVGVVRVALSGIDGIYAAQMRISKIQIYGILAAVVSFAMLLVGISLKVSLPCLAAITSAPSVLGSLILLGELYLADKRVLVPVDIPSVVSVLKEALPTSMSFLGIRICELILSMLPNLIIARVLDLSSVAVFGVASRLATIPLTLLTSVLPVFWPAFTIAWSRGEKKWLRKRIHSISLYSAVILAINAAFVTLFGPMIISWWTNGRVEVPAQLLMLLGILVVIQGCVYWLSTFLHSISDFRFELMCHGLAAAFLAPSAWVLTKNFGLAGLLAAMSLSWAIGCLIPMMYRVDTKLPRTL